MKFIAATLAALLPFAAHAQGCSGMKVAIGGISGFVDLAKPSNTDALRTCNPSLYLHWYAWSTTPPDKKQAILALFKGDPIIEIDLHSNYFQGLYATQFPGIAAHEAHVNYFDVNHPLSEWTQFVDAGRAAGLSVMAPIFTPNNGQWRQGAFSSPLWDKVRQAASYGGGLTLDPPSDVFIGQGAGYQAFAVDEIKWANANHLVTTVIISPGKSGGNFLQDTQALVATLHGAKADPTQYVVENYEPHPAANYVNKVGNDHAGQTVAAIALWVAQQK
jgi:hypothetical protein